MADERPIIIKKIKKVAAGHHGGAWKVAYADFVTAMMAFFLLLWLLNAVTEEQKKGIAAYFRPTLAVQNTSATFTILTGQAQPMDDMSGGASQDSETEDEDQAMQQAPATGEGDRPQSMDGDKPDIGTGNEPQPGKGDKPVDLEEAEKAVAAAEQKQLEQIQQDIKNAIQEDPELKALEKNLKIDQTEDGIRIQLLDQEKISMFPSGSAAMNPRSKELLAKVAEVVKTLPNKIEISGHTDAKPVRRRRQLHQLGAFRRSRQRVAPGPGWRRHQRRPLDHDQGPGRHRSVREDRSVRSAEPAHQHRPAARTEAGAGTVGWRRDHARLRPGADHPFRTAGGAGSLGLGQGVPYRRSTDCAPLAKPGMPLNMEGRFPLGGSKGGHKVTERKLPAIVLGGTSNSRDDGAIHDPLLHPELYDGVALRRMLAFFVDLVLISLVMLIAIIPLTVLVDHLLWLADHPGLAVRHCGFRPAVRRLHDRRPGFRDARHAHVRAEGHQLVGRPAGQSAGSPDVRPVLGHSRRDQLAGRGGGVPEPPLALCPRFPGRNRGGAGRCLERQLANPKNALAPLAQRPGSAVFYSA